MQYDVRALRGNAKQRGGEGICSAPVEIVVASEQEIEGLIPVAIVAVGAKTVQNLNASVLA